MPVSSILSALSVDEPQLEREDVYEALSARRPTSGR
ncbi:MAG: hypothetical protein AB1609_15050 [Bacillota bacterium]